MEVKSLEPSEVKEFVLKEYKDFNASMISKLSGINEKQRWLIYGRIINMIFTGFYGMSITTAQNEVIKRETK